MIDWNKPIRWVNEQHAKVLASFYAGRTGARWHIVANDDAAFGYPSAVMYIVSESGQFQGSQYPSIENVPEHPLQELYASIATQRPGNMTAAGIEEEQCEWLAILGKFIKENPVG